MGPPDKSSDLASLLLHLLHFKPFLKNKRVKKNNESESVFFYYLANHAAGVRDM